MFTPPSFHKNCECCSASLPESSLTYIEVTDEYLCEACHEKYMADKAEKQQQADQEEYYGG
jgi:hypothetical protein